MKLTVEYVQLTILCYFFTLVLLGFLAKIDFEKYKIKNNHVFIFAILMLFIYIIRYNIENMGVFYDLLSSFIQIDTVAYYVFSKMISLVVAFSILYIIWSGKMENYIQIGGGDFKLFLALAIGYRLFEMFFIVGFSVFAMFALLTLMMFINPEKARFLMNKAPVAYYLFFGFLIFSVIDIVRLALLA